MSAPETGYAFPWEREAMRGAELPKGLSLDDQKAYTLLRDIYRDYHNKRIERAAASAEKRRIIAAWRQAKDAAEFQRKLAFYHAQVIKATEAAQAAFRKKPTIDNAWHLSRVLDGLERPWDMHCGG